MAKGYKPMWTMAHLYVNQQLWISLRKKWEKTRSHKLTYWLKTGSSWVRDNYLPIYVYRWLPPTPKNHLSQKAFTFRLQTLIISSKFRLYNVFFIVRVCFGAADFCELKWRGIFIRTWGSISYLGALLIDNILFLIETYWYIFISNVSQFVHIWMCCNWVTTGGCT